RATRSAISARQGPHQVAQKLRSTTLPCAPDNDTGLPSRSLIWKSGAGSGFLTRRITSALGSSRAGVAAFSVRAACVRAQPLIAARPANHKRRMSSRLTIILSLAAKTGGSRPGSFPPSNFLTRQLLYSCSENVPAFLFLNHDDGTQVSCFPLRLQFERGFAS